MTFTDPMVALDEAFAAAKIKRDEARECVRRAGIQAKAADTRLRNEQQRERLLQEDFDRIAAAREALHPGLNETRRENAVVLERQGDPEGARRLRELVA